MSLGEFALVLLALGVCLIPIWLLRDRQSTAQGYFVAARPAAPNAVCNSAVAYAMRLAMLGPLFALGARGEFVAPLVAACSLAIGLFLIHRLRRPIVAFLHDALERDRPITVHAFIAIRHGGDPRVRACSAALSALWLFGLVVIEAFAVAALLKPLLPETALPLWWLSAFGMLAMAALYAIPAGHSGAMQSAQLQLGLSYFGLFGATALVLYLHVSALNPMPPHGTFAVLVAGGTCAAMIVYRRSKYVDGAAIVPESAMAAALGRFLKVFNVCISVAAVLLVVVALMEFSLIGATSIVRDAATALLAGSALPGTAFLALALLPLVQPIADGTNWQRLAALEKSTATLGADVQEMARKRYFRIYSIEAPMLWLFVAAFGAIAIVSTHTPQEPDIAAAFLEQLLLHDNLVTSVALSCFLMALFGFALSTMSAALQAGFAAIRYDIVPVLEPRLEAGTAQPADEVMARRRAVFLGMALCIVLASLGPVIPSAHSDFTSLTFLGLVFALSCVQLALVPLILGPLVGGSDASVSPSWALAILGCGAASGLAAAAAYLVTGSEAWLWAAVPACLGIGALMFAAGR